MAYVFVTINMENDFCFIVKHYKLHRSIFRLFFAFLTGPFHVKSVVIWLFNYWLRKNIFFKFVVELIYKKYIYRVSVSWLTYLFIVSAMKVCNLVPLKVKFFLSAKKKSYQMHFSYFPSNNEIFTTTLVEALTSS